MPRIIFVLSAWIAFVLLSGCRRSDGTRSFTTKTVVLTQPQLQERVAARFPVKVAKPMVTVTLESPKVLLPEGDHRIGIDLDATIKLALGPPLTGVAAVTGELGYEPSGRAFHFRNPRVEKLDIAGLKPEHDELARRAAQSVAVATLNAIPVYELNHSMTEFVASAVLKEVIVKDGALHISVGLP